MPLPISILKRLDKDPCSGRVYDAVQAEPTERVRHLGITEVRNVNFLAGQLAVVFRLQQQAEEGRGV